MQIRGCAVKMLRAPCSRCLPDSPRKTNIGRQVTDKNVDIVRLQHLPYMNVIGQNNKEWKRPWLFGDIRYTWSRQSYSFKQVGEYMKKSKRIEQAATSHVQNSIVSPTERDYKRAKNVARKHYHNMRATMFDIMIKCAAYFFVKTLKLVFDRVISVPSQMEAIKDINDSDIPVVYVPLHMSHFDYIFVTYMLWNYNLPPVHVASGDNLNFSGLGWVLRCLGGFYIRRRMEDKGAARDEVYRAVLQTYIEAVLAKGYSVEFFPEGGRSRFGKIQQPKTGIMSVLSQACHNGLVRDIWLVPVSISYECLMEGVFVRELLGQPKQRESMWEFFKTGLKAINKQHGTARIDFGTPVSFNKYIDGLKESVVTASASSHVLCSPSTLILETVGKFDSQQTQQHDRLDSKAAVHALCDHIMHDCMSYGTVTVTQLVACALLGRGEALDVDDVISDCHWLLAMMHKPLIDNSERICQEDILKAAKLFGEKVISVQSSFGDNDSGIDDGDLSPPQMTARINHIHNAYSVLNLAYYKNTAMQHIAVDTIMATAFHSLASSENGFVIGRNDFIERTSFLADLLSNEFMLVPPCCTIEEVVIGKLDGPDLQYPLYRTLEDQAEKLQLNDDNSLNRIVLLKNLLEPFVYSYLLTAQALCTLPDQGVKEKEFMLNLLNSHNAALLLNIKEVPLESINKASITNAIYFFTRWGHVIKNDAQETLSLNPALKNSKALQEIIQNIKIFVPSP